MTDPRGRIRAAARLAAQINGRVGPILHLIDSVAGADPGVRQLQERLLAAQRADTLLFVRSATKGLRRGLTAQRAADVLHAVGGHRTWQLLVREGGWSPKQYERWLDDTLARLLLAD